VLRDTQRLVRAPKKLSLAAKSIDMPRWQEAILINLLVTAGNHLDIPPSECVCTSTQSVGGAFFFLPASSVIRFVAIPRSTLATPK
jgi:hypothetical protein